MKPKKREAAKAQWAARHEARNQAAARAAEQRAKNEAAILRALAPRQNHDAAWLPATLRDALASKAPRLIDAAHRDALRRLLELPPIRAIEDWSPRGKASSSLFRSLATHLLAAYPVPAIVWNAFDDDNASALVPLAVHVGRGGSLFAWAKTSLAVPLTRKMCHELLVTPSSFGLTDAIRRVQVRTAGGDRRFFDAFRETRIARQIGTRADEAFWASVIEWAAHQPMIDPRELPPLFDYVDMRHREDPAFSMKGRSGLALLRAMREWHGLLSREKAVRGTIFRRSGLSGFEVRESRRENGVQVVETWRVMEILNAPALADEGKRMGHCVYSYAWRIEKGDTSIWTVQMEDGQGATGRWHMATVEVRNDLKRVVQARGRFNRATTPKELRIITRWAAINGLTVSLGAW